MKRFADEEGFIARQLTDTAYATRLARQYLTEICPPNKVWAVPGRLTALLRGKWGLNTILGNAPAKDRNDHRHHVIDAATAAVTDRGLLQQLARANETERQRIAVPEPWDGFRGDLETVVLTMTVSHKPDHGRQGRLHEETAYGMVADPNAEDGHNLVYRKAFADLNPNEAARIRDRALRRRVLDALYEAEGAGTKPREALAAFAKETGIRRVRLLKKEEGTIPIADPRSGAPYKTYSPGDNHHVDIWELPDGKWAGVGVTVFEANRNAAEQKKPHPAARRVMRVHKGDLMKLDRDGTEKIYRVVKLEPSLGNRRVVLAGHYDSGNLPNRNKDPDDPFRWIFATFGKMKGMKARLVRVDALGRVRDPGPPNGSPAS